MEDKDIDLAKLYSKTFVFEDVIKAADAVNTLNLRAVYGWHENQLRITVQGNQLCILERLMRFFGAEDGEGDPGKWRDTAE